MDERTWLNRVWAMAQAHSWKCWHFAAPMRANRTGGFVGDARGSGLPDLLMIHDDPPRMILAELKGSEGKPTEKQREFLTAARNVAESSYAWTDTALDTEKPRLDGQAMLGVYLWRPEDEPIVERILRSRVLA